MLAGVIRVGSQAYGERFRSGIQASRRCSTRNPIYCLSLTLDVLRSLIRLINWRLVRLYGGQPAWRKHPKKRTQNHHDKSSCVKVGEEELHPVRLLIFNFAPAGPVPPLQVVRCDDFCSRRENLQQETGRRALPADMHTYQEAVSAPSDLSRFKCLDRRSRTGKKTRQTGRQSDSLNRKLNRKLC